MMKRVSFYAWVYVLTVCLLAPIGAGGATVPLKDNWQLSNADGSIRCKASVPSTVAGTLDASGFWGEDLMEGCRYVKADRSIFDACWIYSTVFSAKPLSGKHYELVFDGLGYRADIFLNGHCLAASDTTFGVFARRSYDVTRILKKHNTLEVRLLRAGKGDLNHGFVDWNPRPLDESMGIVRPVTLRETGLVSVEDVFVIPDLNVKDFSEADLQVRLRLRNVGNKPVKATLNLKIGQEQGCVPVDLPARGETLLTLTPSDLPLLHIANPRVWWSHDLGNPELYALEAGVSVGGKLSDRKEVTFGIRKIESRLIDGDHRQFTLNGHDILIKGAGWTDDLFLRDDPASLRTQISYVKDMNLNTIRFENIWGKDDTIYDLCDREGVLALVGWSCQWEWQNYCGLPEVKGYGCINTPETEDLAVRYFHDQIVRLHNHVSIIGWMTGSDQIPNERLEARYMEIYKGEEYRPYICSASHLKSAFGGPSGSKMCGPYEYVGPNYWFLDRKAGGAFGFNTETGIGANLPQTESLLRMIPEQDRWPFGPSWAYHCTSSTTAMNSLDALLAAVEGQYGAVSGLEDFVRKAHAVDYSGTRAMFEAFRVRRPGATGIVQWMLNSAWPSLYWQLYDWYGVPTAAYYGTRKACQPLQLIFDYATRKVYAVNGTARVADVRARIRVYDEASALLSDETVSLRVDTGFPAFAANLSSFDGRPHFVALELQDAQGNKLADNFYCLAAQDHTYDWGRLNWYVTPVSAYPDLAFSMREPQEEPKLTVSAFPGGCQVTLENRSDRLVSLNILKALKADGTLAVPAFWSDNFFPLLPYERRTVTLLSEEKDLTIIRR